MPQIRDIALEELAAAGDAALPIAGTRVDPAHSIGNPPAAPPPLTEMPVDLAIADMVGIKGVVQLESQADQLAAHLQKRHEELSRCEAELNSQRADFDQELRDARLWLAERDEELNDREKRLNAREAEMSAREARLSTREAERPSSELTRRTDQPEPSLIQDRIAARRERQQSLARAKQQLDRRRAALEEFWQDLSRTRERALELRLLAEELLAQLRSSLGVGRAGEALAAVRQRLSKRYQTEVAQLANPPHELDWLKEDLASEHERLEGRYEELRLQGRS